MHLKWVVNVSIIALALSMGAFVATGAVHLAPFGADSTAALASPTVERPAPILLCDNCFWGALGRNPAWGQIDHQGILAATGLQRQDESESADQSSFFQSVLRYLLSTGGAR